MPGPIILPGSKDMIADWRAPLSCGNYNVKTGQVLGTELLSP